MKAWKNILLASMYTLALGCSGNNSSGLDDFSSTTPSSGTSTEAPSESPLYLIVTTKLDGTENTVVRTSNCHIPAGTAIGTPGVPSAAYASCSISIPELTLHHSSFKFIIGTTDANVCEKVIFRPFYYTRTLSSLPQVGATPLDCTVSPTPAGCFGGAAPAIVTDFPANRSMFHLPSANLSTTYNMKSLDERRADDKAFSVTLTNADVANANFDMTAGASPIVGSHGVYYDDAEDQMDSYVVSCEDAWATPIYTLTLTITDEDSTSGGFVFDHIWDWNAP